MINLIALEDVCWNSGDGPCVFPCREEYGDRLYHRCDYDWLGRAWCATEVNSNLVMIDDKWGFCGYAERCTGKDKYHTNKQRGINNINCLQL